MKNPWLSLWLSAANSWAGAARGFWMAEMQRQQNATMSRLIEETARVWMQAWSVQPQRRRPKSRTW
jgi:hypothetical protein